MKTLRLNHKLTLNELSKRTNLTVNTLISIEKGRLTKPSKYHYYYIICNLFNVNHITYLELNKMKEDTIENIILKFRAYLGVKSNKELSTYIFNKKYYLEDMLKRKTINKHLYDKKCIILVETFQRFKKDVESCL